MRCWLVGYWNEPCEICQCYSALRFLEVRFGPRRFGADQKATGYPRVYRNSLRKYGYPPDKQEKATQTVLRQAELLCHEWAA